MTTLVEILMVTVPGILMLGTLYAGFRLIRRAIGDFIEGRACGWDYLEDDDDENGALAGDPADSSDPWGLSRFDFDTVETVNGRCGR